jgi:hypothetical protein
MALTIEQMLLEKHGPLLTIAQVAQLLNRSPNGLRVTLRARGPVSEKLSGARVKLGRRVHFKTHLIAQLIESL